MDLPKPRDAAEQKVLRDFEEHGWHLVHVMPEGDTPGWSFTVGLHRRYGHPEILVFGVPHEVAHDLLNLAGEAIGEGRTFESGPAYGDFLEGYDCVLRDVRAGWFPAFLGIAVWFYQGIDFPVRQLFWPDRARAMPWDDAAPEWLRATQPLLYESDPVAARAEALLATLDEHPDPPS